MLALLFSSVTTTLAPTDVGYELLFTDDPAATTTIEWECWDAPALPDWVNGSWIMPTASQFSIGKRRFQGVLDGFGKLHRFQLAGQQVCLKARMMMTKFYNDSIATGTVAPGILFDETVPPRDTCKLLPMCNIHGPNDNTFVNTIQVSDDHFTTWTDSTQLNRVDVHTLRVDGKWNWTDSLEQRGHFPLLGSAHPVRRDGDGDWVALDIEAPQGLVKPGSVVFQIFTIPHMAPHRRQLVYKAALDSIPYFHSFGVTPRYTVLGFTPMKMKVLPLLLNKPMRDSFEQAQPLVTTFRVVPFNSSEGVREFTPMAPFTYNHIVNVFENASGVVFDAVTWQKASLWLTQAGSELSFNRNKTARDAWTDRQQIWRYVLHFNDSSVTSEPISVAGRLTEFPKINMDLSTRPYCIYYAVEFFHNDREYGSMAIVKHNICSGERLYWYKPSHFPSEPYFISRHTEHEDDGVVAFTVLDGTTGTSHLMLVDATDMVHCARL